MNNSPIDQIMINVPLSIPEVLHWVGHVASKVPYKNGEGLRAEAICKKIAGKIKGRKVEVPVKAVDILVKMVDQERLKGNVWLVEDVKELIQLLKGGIDRKIVGFFLKGLDTGQNIFTESDNGDLKTEIIIPRKQKT